MNLHDLSFEDILGICASLDDPAEAREMIHALELLEKNIRYQRKRLLGVLAEATVRDRKRKEKAREELKQSLRIIRTEDENADSDEEAPR